MPQKIWLSALLVSFVLFVVLLLLKIPTIFMVLLILILGIGSAVLTKIFISEPASTQTMQEKWLFLFVSSLFVYLIGLLVEGDLAILLPLMLIYCFGLFIFNSMRSFFLYSFLAIMAISLQSFLNGVGFSLLTTESLWGYLAIFFSLTLFLFLYNHDFKVKSKAFHLMTTELDHYQQRQQGGSSEFTIRTNKDLEIISTSEYSQKALFNYQTSVTGKKLFTVLYVKDEKEVLVGNNNKLMNDLVEKQEQITLDNMTLLLPNTAKQYACTLAVHPIITMTGEVEQIEFSLTVPDLRIPMTASVSIFESQRMAFLSLLMTLKNRLESGNLKDGLFVSQLAERGYRNLNLAEDLNAEFIPELSVIDTAQAMKIIAFQEKKAADSFLSELIVVIDKQYNQQSEDPLFPNTIPAESRNLTGPYYSIQTDRDLFNQLMSLIVFCFFAVTAFDKKKQQTIHITSDNTHVQFTFSAETSIDAQVVFRKLFEKRDVILRAGEVPYTLGIEGVLIERILKLLKGSFEYTVGSRSSVVMRFERYVSGNSKLAFNEG